MKKLALITFSALLLSMSSANAFWDPTFGMFGAAYDYVADTSLSFIDDFYTDSETSTDDDSWLYSAPLMTDPNTGIDLNYNSCAAPDYSWCPYCSWGWDLLSGLFDDIAEDVECKRDEHLVQVQSVEPTAKPDKTLDEAAYCSCIDKNSFPDPSATDVIKNLVEVKKKEMVAEVFEEYQDVAKSLQALAINPEYGNLIDSKEDICLPGNFAKIEAGLFDSGTENDPAPCDGEARDLMKEALETEMDTCKSSDIVASSRCSSEKPYLRHRQSMEEYNQMINEMGPDGAPLHEGIDNKSIGSWFDFQLKKEFEESTVERFNLPNGSVRNNSEIYKSDFATLGFDFYNLGRNDAIKTAIEKNRTP
ncbi:MAG: hypothetical protein KC493_10940, partial [Bacteriovoracaceae bacterium]|nr:hypothetical protein [Bacteriovoracaceae bacterium]